MCRSARAAAAAWRARGGVFRIGGVPVPNRGTGANPPAPPRRLELGKNFGRNAQKKKKRCFRRSTNSHRQSIIYWRAYRGVPSERTGGFGGGSDSRAVPLFCFCRRATPRAAGAARRPLPSRPPTHAHTLPPLPEHPPAPSRAPRWRTPSMAWSRRRTSPPTARARSPTSPRGASTYVAPAGARWAPPGAGAPARWGRAGAWCVGSGPCLA